MSDLPGRPWPPPVTPEGTDGAVGTFDVSVDGAPFASLELTADQST